MSEREEVLLERCFVLHHRPYRNTSLIVDCLTLDHGRIGLVARGSRRPGTGHRALLQPFAPLRISWVRRGDLGRLTHVESDGATLALEGDGLLAGFYVNELLLRLVERGDHNAALHSCYSSCLSALATRSGVARTLRLFELQLLETLGYRVELERDAETGRPLRQESEYVFELEVGLKEVSVGGSSDAIAGRHLISLREGLLDDAASLRASKQLLGRILRTYLGDRPLRSREVLRDLVDGGYGR